MCKIKPCISKTALVVRYRVIDFTLTLLFLSACSYKTITVLSMKTPESSSASISRKYRLLFSLSARVSDTIKTFYSEVSKIATLIITLVGTTN